MYTGLTVSILGSIVFKPLDKQLVSSESSLEKVIAVFLLIIGVFFLFSMFLLISVQIKNIVSGKTTAERFSSKRTNA